MRKKALKRNWEKLILSVLGVMLSTSLAIKTWDAYALLLVLHSGVQAWRAYISHPTKEEDNGDLHNPVRS